MSGFLLWVLAVWCTVALVFGVAWAVVMGRHVEDPMSNAVAVVLSVLGLLVLGAAIIEFVLFLTAAVHR